jgi:hypothetical protein
MMNFFMDELYIASSLENLPEKIGEFEQLTQAMDEISSSPLLKFYYTYDLHSLNFNGKSFAELLYAHYGDGEYRDAILMFDLAVQKGECLDLENERPLDSGVLELSRLGGGGCLSSIDYRAERWWDDEAMCSVHNLPTLTAGLRKLFVKNGFQVEQMTHLSELMFPGIYFHAEIGEIKSLGVSFREFADSIIDHLAYLNDHAVNDFKNPVPAQVIQLAASRGVEISPESPNTHSNIQAMSKRRIEINGVSLTCEWHTKITYNKGRIHFHARPDAHHQSILKTTRSKLIVGIITEHLPT